MHNNNRELVEKLRDHNRGTIAMSLNKKGVTIILVTHDPSLMTFCTHEFKVSDGEVLI